MEMNGHVHVRLPEEKNVSRRLDGLHFRSEHDSEHNLCP
jgi:hypothetical protein